MSGTRPPLDYFFAPRSIALFGITAAPHGLGQQVLRSLIEGGYQGEIYPIHPQLRHSLGLPCFNSLAEVPTDVDLAIFATPPQAILPQLDSLAKRRVKAMIIISGGFKEKTPEGGRLQDQIVEEARSRGMRVIGPNCQGVYDPKTKAQTLFQSYERLLRPGPGKIALITQSTALGCTILEWLAEEGIGISRFVGYGNRSDLDEADFLQYLKNDIDTKLIGIHTESFRDGRRFLEVARLVAERKPVIILKTGRTERAVESVATHTGSLAGSHRVQTALFRQAGLIEADTIEEFVDALKIYSFYEGAGGRSIGVVTNGAGLSVMTSDLAEKFDLEIADYQAATREGLRQILPTHAIIGDAVDLMGSATSEDYRLAMELLLRDEKVDLLLVCLVLQNTFLDARIVDVTASLLRTRKPIIACATGGPFSRRRIAALQMGGIPVFPTPERAVRAIGHLVSRSERIGKSLEQLQSSSART
jgi:acetate---CoA ligase (ADP-forming) subunit alpha